VSHLAPDIPELQQVPDAARSLVYFGALNRAIRSPLTWLMAGAAFAVAVGSGAMLGGALFGTAGALFGAALGAGASVWCVFKIIISWRTRRLVPSAIQRADPAILEDVRRADENVRRMIDAYNRRDAE
jgi:hypothetical protein